MTQAVDDETLVESFPYAQIDHDTKHMYRGWLEKRLLMMRCDACGLFNHPAKPVCPACWSDALTPTEVSGRGVIHLRMLLHQGPPAPGVDYAQGPHPVMTVELEEQEGLRFTTTIIDCPLEEAQIGLPVELDWIDRFGSPFPVFRPAFNPRSQPSGSGTEAGEGS